MKPTHGNRPLLSLIAVGLVTVIVVHSRPDAGLIVRTLVTAAAGEVPSAEWHEFFIAIVTASTTMLAATIAVAAFAQRPRDTGEAATLAVRAMTAALTGTIRRIILTPLVLFSSSMMLSVFMLIPHFAVRHLQSACVMVALLEITFLVVFETEIDEIRSVLAALGDLGGEAMRLYKVRAELVEALQPYLPGSSSQGRPLPLVLLDLTKPLEAYSAPDDLRARITAHNTDREARLAEALAGRDRHRSDMPFIREAERLTPPILRHTLLGVGVITPLLLYYASTPPLIALVVVAMTFLGLVYVILALLALLRANVARLLEEPPREA